MRHKHHTAIFCYHCGRAQTDQAIQLSIKSKTRDVTLEEWEEAGVILCNGGCDLCGMPDVKDWDLGGLPENRALVKAVRDGAYAIAEGADPKTVDPSARSEAIRVARFLRK